MTSSPHDPRGVIAEAYKIENISAPECRSIFLDWALEPREFALSAAVEALAGKYADLPDHPMTRLLIEASTKPAPPAKRRGRRRRK